MKSVHLIKIKIKPLHSYGHSFSNRQEFGLKSCNTKEVLFYFIFYFILFYLSAEVVVKKMNNNEVQVLMMMMIFIDDYDDY